MHIQRSTWDLKGLSRAPVYMGSGGKLDDLLRKINQLIIFTSRARTPRHRAPRGCSGYKIRATRPHIASSAYSLAAFRHKWTEIMSQNGSLALEAPSRGVVDCIGLPH